MMFSWTLLDNMGVLLNNHIKQNNIKTIYYIYI